MNAKAKMLITLAVVLLIGFLIYLSSSFYQTFALSVIVAYFVHPIKKKIKDKIGNENAASFLSMTIGSAVLLIFLIIFITSIFNSLSGIASFAKEPNNIRLVNQTINLVKMYNVQELISTTGGSKVSEITQTLIMSAPQLLLNIIIFLFMLFYFIKYGEEIIASIKGLVPPGEAKLFDKFLSRVDSMMRAIFKGQFLTALLQSFLLFIFMLVLGLPFAMELSFFTFLLCFFNITVVIVPMGITIYYLYQGYLTGTYTLFIISLLFLLIISSIDNVVKPMISRKDADFNPVLFILGLIGGAMTLGFTGFIVGPLITGMFQASLEILKEQ